MADLINLRQERKRRARKSSEDEASANRAHFGRSQAERNLQSSQSEQQARNLDAHRREPKAPSEPQD